MTKVALERTDSNARTLRAEFGVFVFSVAVGSAKTPESRKR